MEKIACFHHNNITDELILMSDEPEVSGMRDYSSKAAYNKTAARGGVTTDLDTLINDQVIIPEMLDILGHIAGHHVLDLACGRGDLARRLAEYGAQVTAIDIADEQVHFARKREAREPKGIIYHFSDSSDLSMIEDTTFDEVVCHMALMDIENLPGTITEAARVIQLGGRFVFSIMHPCFLVLDNDMHPVAGGQQGLPEGCTYFDEGSRLMDLTVDGNQKAWMFHRTLATYINAVAARGFTIRRVAEPRPSKEVVSEHPDLEPYLHSPIALIVEAVFPHD